MLKQGGLYEFQLSWLGFEIFFFGALYIKCKFTTFVFVLIML